MTPFILETYTMYEMARGLVVLLLLWAVVMVGLSIARG